MTSMTFKKAHECRILYDMSVKSLAIEPALFSLNE